MSLFSAGCLIWLDALRPLFATTAVTALAWQAWLVWRRPAARRTFAPWAILAGTAAVNALVVVAWAALQLRYR